MTSTIFDKNAYDDGIRDAIAKVIDDWGFRYPGIDRRRTRLLLRRHRRPARDDPRTISTRPTRLGGDFGASPRRPRATLTTNRTGGVIEDPRRSRGRRLVERQRQTCDRCAATQHEGRASPCTTWRDGSDPSDIEPQLEMRAGRRARSVPTGNPVRRPKRIWIAGKPDGGLARRDLWGQPLLLRVRRLRDAAPSK